jgi:hypothetical protein
MRSEALHDLIHATPFKPFEIRLPDGHKIEVIHPDYIAHPRGGRIAVVFDRDQRTYYVDVALVSALELVPGPEKPNGGT